MSKLSKIPEPLTMNLNTDIIYPKYFTIGNEHRGSQSLI